jgi:hypothetical protein
MLGFSVRIFLYRISLTDHQFFLFRLNWFSSYCRWLIFIVKANISEICSIFRVIANICWQPWPLSSNNANTLTQTLEYFFSLTQFKSCIYFSTTWNNFQKACTFELQIWGCLNSSSKYKAIPKLVVFELSPGVP